MLLGFPYATVSLRAIRSIISGGKPMNGKLAIHGGPPTVPEGLKRRWPEITQEDKDAVLAVLERNVLSCVHGPEATALERA
jgi:hypothetical protein